MTKLLATVFAAAFAMTGAFAADAKKEETAKPAMAASAAKAKAEKKTEMVDKKDEAKK